VSLFRRSDDEREDEPCAEVICAHCFDFGCHWVAPTTTVDMGFWICDIGDYG